MAEWLMAADCKSAALTCCGGSNPSLPTIPFPGGPGAGFPGPLRAPRRFSASSMAHVAQLVEHVLGKDGVSSSNLLVGSKSSVPRGNPKPGFPRTPSAAQSANQRQSRDLSLRGSNSGVESQPSKLLVAGSNPVSRSNDQGIHLL